MSNPFFDNETINEVIKDKLKRKLVKFNGLKYAYAIMNKRNPANFAIVSDAISWFDIYKKNNFQFIDPVLITASNRVTPFPWDENIMVKSGVKFSKLFDAAKEYNVVNGYTFVLHDAHNNLVVLSFLLDNHSADQIEEIEKNKDKLQMLLMTMHEELTHLYQELNSPAYFDRINHKEIFSGRENEVLYLASMGKSYQEIAQILGVKLTTIKYHMGNAVQKLGVTNAKHAIRLGVELQLIRPTLSDTSK